MLTTQELINKIRIKAGASFGVYYSHPDLYVVHRDEAYNNLDSEQRIEVFCKNFDIMKDDVSLLIAADGVQVCPITAQEWSIEYSFLDDGNRRNHWLELLAGVQNKPQNIQQNHFKTIHFYGYKGGQARSTVLGMLAKHLAENGYKVLLIDADMEAPSLDHIFQAKASRLAESLLGICQFEEIPSSINVHQINHGMVDLIACRPDGEIYDLDFSSFTLHSIIDPSILNNGLEKISNFANEKKYDYILIDHRTGLSGSVLPLVVSLPGPIIACVRRDVQSLSGARLFKSLFSQFKENPGMYISFSLDNEFSENTLSKDSLKIQEDLLMQFPEEFIASAEDAIDSYWVDWYYDRAFINTPKLPDPNGISKINQDGLRKISSTLGLLDEQPKEKKPEVSKTSNILSPSGAAGKGIYLEAKFLKRLLSANSPFTYIFGRKGTGKTRLLLELDKRRLGRPILCASDYSEASFGLQSGEGIFTEILNRNKNEPISIWWTLLLAGLRAESNPTREEFRRRIDEILKENNSIGYGDIRQELQKKTPDNHYTYLVDGVETAFPFLEMRKNVETLFRFLLTLQTDSLISSRVTVRLFLRSDLAKNAIENVEQQVDGRDFPLRWDEQSIFNFVLLRISQLDWFLDNFPDECAELKNKVSLLLNGALSSEECEPLLMKFFPARLRASNIQTMTFLRTYFSDTVDSTYSPRLYDRFLEAIVSDEIIRLGEAEKIENGKLSQRIIMLAHQSASTHYLSEVKTELKPMLDPIVDIEKFISSFKGLSTPFEVNDCIEKLHEKTSIEKTTIRDSLYSMKEIGMFEERQGFSSQWRVGRLFKSSLGMKYVRGQKLT